MMPKGQPHFAFFPLTPFSHKLILRFADFAGNVVVPGRFFCSGGATGFEPRVR